MQKTVASPGRGILAMDESNATCGKRLASIGLENTEANRQAYRTLLVTAPGLGQYISGAILFEETLYQSAVDGRKIVDILAEQGIVPGIKVDKGLVPLAGSNNESWCQGLDGLAAREAAYYQAGARFAKWRTVVSIPNGPSELAVKEAAWGLARYAAISQVWILFLDWTIGVVNPATMNDMDQPTNNDDEWYGRTTGLCRSWSLRSSWTASTASSGPSRWRRRCGPRPSTPWPRTTSCSRASCSSPPW